MSTDEHLQTNICSQNSAVKHPQLNITAEHPQPPGRVAPQWFEQSTLTSGQRFKKVSKNK